MLLNQMIFIFILTRKRLHNFSLSVEENFKNCFSDTTVTYNNPPLWKENTSNVTIVNCELWTFSI